jgi:predicted transcriptional regulator
MLFDKTSCRWSILGVAAEVQRSDGRRKILAALADAAGTMSTQEIADAAGIAHGTVRSLIHRMVKDGEIIKEGRGRYGRPAQK